jgi:tRNA (guanine37-N1)-methyltransferase
MQVYILTLFPDMFESPLNSAIFRRAKDRGMVEIHVRDIREHAHDRHRTTDDYPYGGGAGMVMKPEPIFEAVEEAKTEMGLQTGDDVPVILLTPQGRSLSQEVAQELSGYDRMILICGHYEGVDERVREYLVTTEISIGDYVISGGELASMVLLDSVVRLVPGVLGSEESAVDDSHAAGLLEYPQYTRPPEYRGWAVPEILLSGNHAQIAGWRREQAIKRTAERRPDLLDKADLSVKDRRLVEELLDKKVI